MYFYVLFLNIVLNLNLLWCIFYWHLSFPFCGFMWHATNHLANFVAGKLLNDHVEAIDKTNAKRNTLLHNLKFKSKKEFLIDVLPYPCICACMDINLRAHTQTHSFEMVKLEVQHLHKSTLLSIKSTYGGCLPFFCAALNRTSASSYVWNHWRCIYIYDMHRVAS